MIRGDLTVRTTKTASGATAVQVVRNVGKRREIVKHIGSTRDEAVLNQLLADAERFAEQHRVQPSLFDLDEDSPERNHFSPSLLAVTHNFARQALLAGFRRCGLGFMSSLYLDLAMMRIIEPTSKTRTLALLDEYFGVHYAERTMWRHLELLCNQKAAIETAAIKTAESALEESFNLVLYDVTTLYFESFKEYDFQTPGFSKDNKPQQPQIVIGLITTRSGFPVMHEVFEGKTFEGHTMLKILERFQLRVGGQCKPVIVADAAMLSFINMKELQDQGYRFIVGARLANHSKSFIQQIDSQIPRIDDACRRFSHCMKRDGVEFEVSVVCHFSTKRYKKDKRELEKQIHRARGLLDRNESGSRARFIKRNGKDSLKFNDELNAKAEKLLGLKGYITNIPLSELTNEQVISYYHDLWHVEQAFRMTKSDLRARPIYHRNEFAIRAHITLCFMALMVGKYLEIKTGLSLKRIRDSLWRVHEAHIRDDQTGKIQIIRMKTDDETIVVILEALKPEFPH